MATDTAKVLETLGKMTVLELVELKNAIEEEWGVSAAAPVAVAAAAPAGGHLDAGVLHLPLIGRVGHALEGRHCQAKGTRARKVTPCAILAEDVSADAATEAVAAAHARPLFYQVPPRAFLLLRPCTPLREAVAS